MSAFIDGLAGCLQRLLTAVGIDIDAMVQSRVYHDFEEELQTKARRRRVLDNYLYLPVETSGPSVEDMVDVIEKFKKLGHHITVGQLKNIHEWYRECQKKGEELI